MKRLFILLQLALMIVIAGCQTEENPTHVVLDIYYLNDLHGAIIQDDQSIGLEGIAALLDAERDAGKNVIFLAGGDMLQGSLISNYFYGLPTIEALDIMGLDAFVVGNHEFDWGIEKVTQFYDGTHDYQAKHPLLAANIVEIKTQSMIPGMEPYTILDILGVKIGIIGTMGYGLESSILTPMIEDYEFLQPVPMIAHFAEHLRINEAVDVIIALNHDSGTSLNPQLLSLEGDFRVDAIFNGHSHRVYAEVYDHVPVIQSGGYGSTLGHVQITLEHGLITEVSARNITRFQDARLMHGHAAVHQVIETYRLEIDHLYTPLFNTTRYQTRENLTQFMSRMMLKATNADFAFHNLGGTRSALAALETISKARITDVFPFTNRVITTTLTAEQVNRLIQFNPHYASTGAMVMENQTYTVALHDYIFYHPANNFSVDDTTIIHDFTIVDLVYQELELRHIVYPTFDVFDPVLINPNMLGSEAGGRDDDTP